MKVVPKKHNTCKRTLYVISADFGYEEYDGVAVIARDMIEAAMLIRGYFKEYQLPLTWKRVCDCDAKKSGIVLASFNAG